MNKYILIGGAVVGLGAVYLMGRSSGNAQIVETPGSPYFLPSSAGATAQDVTTTTPSSSTDLTALIGAMAGGSGSSADSALLQDYLKTNKEIQLGQSNDQVKIALGVTGLQQQNVIKQIIGNSARKQDTDTAIQYDDMGHVIGVKHTTLETPKGNADARIQAARATTAEKQNAAKQAQLDILIAQRKAKLDKIKGGPLALPSVGSPVLS